MTMTDIPNPFFVGGPVPPKHFVGRTIELNTAFDQIMSRGHMAISGSPGMGKSSFLRFISDQSTWQERGLDFSTVVVSLNCTDINPFTPANFWREILLLLRDKLEGHAPIQQTIDQVFQEEDGIETRDLRRVLRQIGAQGKFLLLLLDDYDAALSTNNTYDEQDMLVFLREFRNLAIHNDAGQHLSTMVVTFRRLSELGPTFSPGGSPWYNHYLFQTLKLFTDNDIHTLFRHIPAELSLTDEQQDAILCVAGRHPALLQRACYLLFQSVQSGQTTFDLHSFINTFMGATEHIFRDIWRFSTEDEQMLLMLIALSDMGGRLNKQRRYTLNDLNLILSQRERQLDDLRDRGVILHEFRDEVSHYFFASSMMGWWVVKEIENSTREDLEQRQKLFFNLSRKQIEQVQNILQQVWESKDAALHVTEWTGKLVGAFAKGIGVKGIGA